MSTLGSLSQPSVNKAIVAVYYYTWLKLSFILFFVFVIASTPVTYILTAPICRTTIITLEPCALHPEFQHFILRFDKKIPYFADATEREDKE
jgi:hypothetical protein